MNSIEQDQIIINSFIKYLHNLEDKKWNDIRNASIFTPYDLRCEWYSSVHECGELFCERTPNNRFRIDKRAMAYMSSDYSNVILETSNNYRSNNCDSLPDFNASKKDIIQSEGQENRQIFQIKVVEDLCLFDLRTQTSRSLKYLFYENDNLINALHNKSQDIYSTTNALAELIASKSFDGILYNGVRGPSNGTYIGDSLALFNEKLINTVALTA